MCVEKRRAFQRCIKLTQDCRSKLVTNCQLLKVRQIQINLESYLIFNSYVKK